MRDPHVVALRYHIEHSAGIAFEDNTPPIERETAAFRMSLAHGIATFQMKDHYSSENRARQIVEMYLRPWEISEAVRPAGTKLRFIFDEAEVIDRDPSPLGPTATVTLMPIPRAEVRLLENRYPDPPDNFTVSPDVEVMWTLYEGYLQGHDRLLPMAYTCLTRFTYGTASNKEAASRYGVSRNVLEELGRLSSTSGDQVAARKWIPGRVPQPLTDRETEWVEDAIRSLIYRAGQYASDPNGEWPKITMKHLPEL
jgi:hypothetical protein